MRPQRKLLSGTTARGKPSSAERPPTLAAMLVHRPVSSLAGEAAQDAASDDDVIDVGGVVRMLRVGRNKVYEMVARNEIPHRRFGRGIRFSRTAIMRWLDSWSPRIVKEGQ
jgi:excisionase family DNA binding protein